MANKHRRAAQRIPTRDHCKHCHGECDDDCEALEDDACPEGCCCCNAHRVIASKEMEAMNANVNTGGNDDGGVLREETTNA